MEDRASLLPISGHVQAAGNSGLIRVQARYPFPVVAVWRALVEPTRLSAWLGTVEGDLREGGEFTAFFLASEWSGGGRIRACAPQSCLGLELTGTDEAVAHPVDITLRAEAQQTVFTVEERNIPAGQLAAYGAGMQIHVEDLAAHLAGRGRCDAVPRWRELLPQYQR